MTFRYLGYKGVLMYHPELDKPQADGSRVNAQFRKSMKKFELTSNDHTFSVVGYSFPFKFGRLNNDIIVLLSSLGITNEVLLRKQKEYFDWISLASTNVAKAVELILSSEVRGKGLNFVSDARGPPADSELFNGDSDDQYKYKIAENLFLVGFDDKKNVEAIRSAQKTELAGFRKKDTDKLKSRILIRDSRLLYGVCDPFGVLQEGEVFVRIRVGRKQLTTLSAIDIIVTRNPCLHPGKHLIGMTPPILRFAQVISSS
jgi:hypothetical protein